MVPRGNDTLRRRAILPASLLELCFIPGSWRRLTGDVIWPSILTDYTYDSEPDIADGVPQSVLTQHLIPSGNHGYIRNLGRSGALLTFVFFSPFVNGAPEQPGYKLSSKYIPLCLAEQRDSYRFGTTWVWENYDRILIFGWTIPSSVRWRKTLCATSISFLSHFPATLPLWCYLRILVDCVDLLAVICQILWSCWSVQQQTWSILLCCCYS